MGIKNPKDYFIIYTMKLSEDVSIKDFTVFNTVDVEEIIFYRMKSWCSDFY